MFAIYKYPLTADDKQVIELPVFSEILCIKVQDDVPVLYAKVNPKEPSMEKHTICIVPTGEEFKDEYNNFIYIDTISIYEDTLIYHIFEYIE